MKNMNGRVGGTFDITAPLPNSWKTFPSNLRLDLERTSIVELPELVAVDLE